MMTTRERNKSIVLISPPRTPPPKQLGWTPIWYVTLHFRDRQGAASLRHRFRRNSSSCVWTDQKPDPVWFLCPRKSYIRYGVHIVIANALRNGVDQISQMID